jgi:hypothetical protein
MIYDAIRPERNLMPDAEKMARLCIDLDQCSLIVEYDLSKQIAENMREAASPLKGET